MVYWWGIGTRHPKVLGSIPNGKSGSVPHPKLVTRRKISVFMLNKYFHPLRQPPIDRYLFVGMFVCSPSKVL